jgi:hypothetical protein
MFLIRPALLRLGLRRLGPLGIGLTAYDVWRRLPAKQRQKLIAHGRKHSGRVADSSLRMIAKRINR